MTIRRDGAWVKQQRIQSIHKMIQGAGDCSLVSILAACEYRFGINRGTARRYIGTLEILDLVQVDENLDLVREVVKK